MWENTVLDSWGQGNRKMLSSTRLSFNWNNQIQAYLVLLHFALLGFTDVAFSQIEGLWQLWVQQVHRRHFSNGVCSLRVTFWYFSQYFKLFHHYYIYYDDLWSVIFDVTIAKRFTEGSVKVITEDSVIMIHWRFTLWLALFSNKVFFN